MNPIIFSGENVALDLKMFSSKYVGNGENVSVILKIISGEYVAKVTKI